MFDRRHALALAIGFAFTTGSAQAQDAASAFVVTYIEVAAKSAAATRGLLKTYTGVVAKRAGSIQFDAFERTDQPNHFAIVETWANTKALEEHAATTAAKDFRTKITPLLSAPYDERPHHALSTGPKTVTKAGAIYAVTHVDIIPPKKDEGVASVKALADKSRGTPGSLRYDALTVNAGAKLHRNAGAIMHQS